MVSEPGRDPALNIAEPIPTTEGHFIVDLLADDHLRHCVLFTWVPGEPLGDGAGTSGYRAMGRLSALLHRHGGWRPPAGLALRRWDRTFYYPPELERVVVEDFRYDHLFSGLRPLLRRAAELGDYFIARRWTEAEPMVVHGDLHEWNVHLYMGRAWAIDFEDVMLALPAQDIATSLYGARTRPDLPAIIDAFRRGYEEHAEWPVADSVELEVYWAAPGDVDEPRRPGAHRRRRGRTSTRSCRGCGTSCTRRCPPRLVSLSAPRPEGSVVPSLEEFCTIQATMAPRMIGRVPAGTRIDFPFEGTATSPHWEGERPVRGVDYVTVRGDGNMDLDIRATIGEGKETVAYTATGVSIAHEDRTASPQELILFQTGNEELAWLNSVVGVGFGHGAEGQLSLTVRDQAMTWT